MPTIGQIYYRYSVSPDPYFYPPYLETFKVSRFTPSGFMVIDQYEITEHFINPMWVKQFAHATKEEALTAYKRRKQKQIKILTQQLDNAKAALANADKTESCRNLLNRSVK